MPDNLIFLFDTLINTSAIKRISISSRKNSARATMQILFLDGTTDEIFVDKKYAQALEEWRGVLTKPAQLTTLYDGNLHNSG
jgi:hypothetical protein